MTISVRSVQRNETYQWLLKKHYAKRKCPISYAFGAFRDHELIGVVTYGTPMSANLRSGICGQPYSAIVLELNRLCCENTPNVASMLVGRSLKMLPHPSIVVSFADTAQGHVGYVYQATNFIYTGLSAKRSNWKVSGLEHMHSGTIADMSRGRENRADYMRERYGDDFYLQERSRKHRYIYFIGNRKQVREMKSALIYPVAPYPKGESVHYDTDCEIQTQGVLF